MHGASWNMRGRGLCVPCGSHGLGHVRHVGAVDDCALLQGTGRGWTGPAAACSARLWLCGARAISMRRRRIHHNPTYSEQRAKTRV
eukprot:406133-Prymnesium_polylepis.1